MAAATLDAPELSPAPEDDSLPNEPATLNLADTNITSVLCALCSVLCALCSVPPDINSTYPSSTSRSSTNWATRDTAGITEQAGPYAVGLPWLTRHYSSIRGGVGLGARHVAASVANGSDDRTDRNA